MSDWRDVLKMPPNINTAQNRDADYTQKIIEYDKNVISPKFEEYIRSQPMNRDLLGFITVDNDRNKDSFYNGIYKLGNETLQALGSNVAAIMQTLENAYRQEGYNTLIEGVGVNKKLKFSKAS